MFTLDDGSKPATDSTIPIEGLTPLPAEFWDDDVGLAFTGKAAKSTSLQSQTVPLPARKKIIKLLRRIQREENHRWVVFSSRKKTKGKGYRYRQRKLRPRPEFLNDGDAEPFLFTWFYRNEADTLYRRMFFAVIPNDTVAIKAMTTWAEKALPYPVEHRSGHETSKTQFYTGQPMITSGDGCYHEIVPAEEDCGGFGGVCPEEELIYVCPNPGSGDPEPPSDDYPTDECAGTAFELCEDAGGASAPNGGNENLCGSGYFYDADGNPCSYTLIPCEGNPVKNPRIAPQTWSKIKGGRYGADARKKKVNGKSVDKAHWGLDLINQKGDPVYSMYDGEVIEAAKKNGWGNYVRVRSTIEGKSIILHYAHLESHLVLSGTITKGTKIGIAGDSGNLKSAIDEGLAIQHLHIEAVEGTDWDTGIKKNPENYITTKFDSTGNVVANTDC